VLSKKGLLTYTGAPFSLGAALFLQSSGDYIVARTASPFGIQI
jgi:hypothetical protein